MNFKFENQGQEKNVYILPALGRGKDFWTFDPDSNLLM